MLMLAATFLLFVGTFSSPSDAREGGIYSLRFDPETGRFSPAVLAARTAKPTFLALHPGGGSLYATTDLEGSKGSPGEFPDTFSITEGSGSLTPLHGQMHAGVPLVHATVHPGGQALCTVSYRGNLIGTYSLSRDGSPGSPVSRITNSGKPGPRSERQDRPHPHGVTLSPDGRHLYVCDLGLDRIFSYVLDPESAALVPSNPAGIDTKPGMGPRHAVFSPDGKFLYVIGELNSTVAVYAREPVTGGLSLLQDIPTLPPGFRGTNLCAEIRMHPGGRFVYGSNRGDDSIAVFRRDPEKGLLEAVQRIPSGGSHPRHFEISPDGKWLICANRDSNNLRAFRIDPSTGELTPSPGQATVPQPTCVLFMTRH